MVYRKKDLNTDQGIYVGSCLNYCMFMNITFFYEDEKKLEKGNICTLDVIFNALNNVFVHHNIDFLC